MKFHVWRQWSSRIAERASVGIVTEPEGVRGHVRMVVRLSVTQRFRRGHCRIAGIAVARTRVRPKLERKRVRPDTRTLQIRAENCTSVRSHRKGKIDSISTPPICLSVRFLSHTSRCCIDEPYDAKRRASIRSGR